MFIDTWNGLGNAIVEEQYIFSSCYASFEIENLSLEKYRLIISDIDYCWGRVKASTHSSLFN